MPEKKIVQFTIIVFIIGGMILITGKTEWFPDFYNPVFMAAMAFISAFAIVLPSFLFQFWEVPRPSDRSLGEAGIPAAKPSREMAVAESDLAKKKQKILLRLQTTLAFALILSGLGGLGLFQLYRIGFEYDKLVHFIAPLLFTITLTYFGREWYAFSIKKSLFLSALFVLALGFAWELWEFSADWLFGTQTLGIYGRLVLKDTIVDNIMNILGIFSGAIFVIFKYYATEHKK